MVFNLFSIPFLLSGILFLLVGLYTLIQAPKAALNRSFFGICLSLTIWLTSTAFLLASRDPVWIRRSYSGLYLGVSFISVTIFTYSSIWQGFYDRQKFYIRLGFVLAAIFTAIMWWTPWIIRGHHIYSWGAYSLLTVYGGGVYLTFFGGYMLALFRNLIAGHKQAKTPLEKRQTKLVLVGFLFAYLGAIDFLPCYGIDVFPIGAFTTFFLVCSLGYTIIRYKLMDIETVIHRTLLWLASTLVAVVPFAVFIYFSHEWFQSLASMPATIYGTTLALTFYIYFHAIQPRLSQLFRRRYAGLEQAIRDFSAELVHLRSMRDLLQRFVRVIRKTLYVSEVSIYLRDEEQKLFLPAIVKRRHGLKPISSEHPFLKWLEDRNDLIVSEYLESEPDNEMYKKEDGQNYLSLTGAMLIVPFVITGKLIGVMHLGRKENLGRYTPAERQFLTQLRVPVTISFSNSMQFENVSKLYQQVQTQNNRLKELDRLKSQFLANTSHELRTPLNGILGLVEAVLDGADGEVNPAQSRHLRMILESGANLKELINNLLELSKLESGQTQLNIKPFNILNAVTVVLALLEGIAHKKGVQLKYESEKDMPDVYGDPEKIQRVLLNLAGNALKFTEKGSVVIRLKKHEGAVRVSVEDTGIGIKEQDLRVIFERFRQADGGETRNYEGTGLGLSIARDIVRLHRSDISVTSQFGQGSIFAFEMPSAPFEQATLIKQEGSTTSAAEPVKSNESSSNEAASADAPQEKIYDVSHDPEEEALVRGQGELVLVVDDNSVNREVIRTRLGMNNYLVVEAVDGQDALEKVKAEKPALVLLDLMMPRMSGYEFCREVRRLYPADELPIIMLTAKTDMGDKVFGLNIGANDYVSKPFQQEELLARVGVLLRIRAMHAELRRWNDELEVRVEERTRELHATQKQLIQAEKMATVGTFAGGIAHEINNPLTAVLTNAQVLKMTSTNEDDKELVDLIEEGAKRCQVIIQKLMKYSRKSDIGAARHPVSLEKVVQSVCSLLSYQFQQDNIALEQDLAGLPAIQGDEGELEQVFTNMILNAKDAILSQGRIDGTIRIQGRSTGNEVRIEVVDNGTGIKKENISKIFDPFFTTKDVGSGTGLGLSVTHGILERHACRVFVESEWGVGTTFVLVFPLGN